MAQSRSSTPVAIRVVIEAGAKRAFASALDWPGWSRSGRDERAALDALAAYAERYRPVVRGSRPAFPARFTVDSFEVVDRVTGNATTDFGAPGIPSALEAEPLTAAEARRLAGLLRRAWATLDAVVASAPPELRKGPRGGGRDRDKVMQHVLGAESGYARSLGVLVSAPAFDDPAAVEALRAGIETAIQQRAEGRWSAAYAARRIAWHVLDHAWEIEDRSEQ